VEVPAVRVVAAALLVAPADSVDSVVASAALLVAVAAEAGFHCKTRIYAVPRAHERS
jgi:hypothetical protein